MIASSKGPILITGGAGYIGSQTAWAFLDAGFEVVIVDDLSAGTMASVPAGAEFHRMDCADPALVDLMRERGIAAAVHFAARIRLDESLSDPLGYYAANTATALAFFRSCLAAGVGSIVFSSTAAVYGDTGIDPVAESRIPTPATPYGRSKLASEWILEDVSRASSMRHVSLRYFNVAGADPQQRTGPRSDAGHLVKVVSEACAGVRDTLVIHGSDWPTSDGTCIRDYIHVADLAAAHVAAVRYLARGGESLTLNCGYGQGFSVREVVAAGLALAVRPFEVVVGPRRAGDMPSVVANTSRMKANLDWQPRHADLASMISHGMAWEQGRAARAA